MEAVATFAVELAVKGTVILLLASGVTLAAGKMSAAFRHWVWCGAFIALLVLPVVVLVTPGWKVVPGWTEKPRIQTEAIVRPKLVTPTPIVQAIKAGPVVASATPLSHAAVSSPVTATNAIAPAQQHAIGWAAVGEWAWAMGLVVMLCPVAGAAIYLRVMERRGRRVTGSAWNFEAVRNSVGIRRRVVMLESAGARMPLTFGIVLPRIVVPAESAEWDATKRRLVLLHELVHVKRLDAATQMVAALVRAMWWFHPLVWVAYRCMAVERERACDDRVLAAGAEPAAYAETLVEIAAGLSSGRFLIGGIAMARQSTLETRVRAVLDGGCNRKAVRAGGMVLAGLMVLAAVPLAALRGADETAAGSAPATEGVVVKESGTGMEKKFPSGATVELVGITHQPSMGPWWMVDGSPVMPKIDLSGQPAEVRRGGARFGGGYGGRNPYHSFLFHFSNVPEDAGAFLYDSASINNPQNRPEILMTVTSKGQGASFVRIDGLASTESPPSVKWGSIKVGIPEGKWEQAYTGAPGESGKSEKGRYVIGGATLPNAVPFGASVPVMEGGAPVATGEGASPQSEILITHSVDLNGKDWRFVAVGADGKDHVGAMRVEGTAGNLQTDVADFADVKPDQIKSVRLETRPIDWVEFTDLPMEPGDAGQLEQQGGRAGGGSSGDSEADAIRAKLMAQRAKENAAKASDNKPAADAKYYYIMGMVDHGGVYALAPHGVSPLQAVAAAGVKSDNQALLVVRVVRNENGKQKEILRQNFNDLLNDQDAPATIQDGDVISVSIDRGLKKVEMDNLQQRKMELTGRLSVALKGNAANANVNVAEVQHALQNVETRMEELEKLPAQ